MTEIERIYEEYHKEPHDRFCEAIEEYVIKARYCKSCGEPLVVNCRTCQAELKKGLNGR